MSKVKTDSQGRIYLSKEFRKKYGDKFRLVEFKGEIKLIPVSDDPLEDLRERTSRIRGSDKGVEELKGEARKELNGQAG